MKGEEKGGSLSTRFFGGVLQTTNREENRDKRKRKRGGLKIDACFVPLTANGEQNGGRRVETTSPSSSPPEVRYWRGERGSFTLTLTWIRQNGIRKKEEKR